MSCLLLVPVLMFPGPSAAVRGQYVEARTCDVFTGSCFANADTGLTGKNAVLAWKVEAGTVAGSKLDGLGVVAVVSASETLGLKQTGPGRAVVIVDDRATTAQRDALVEFVKAQAGGLVGEVVAVRGRPDRPDHLPLRRRGVRHPDGRDRQGRDPVHRRRPRQGVRQRDHAVPAAGQGRGGQGGGGRRALVHRQGPERDVERRRPPRGVRRHVRGPLKSRQVMQ